MGDSIIPNYIDLTSILINIGIVIVPWKKNKKTMGYQLEIHAHKNCSMQSKYNDIQRIRVKINESQLRVSRILSSGEIHRIK